MGDCGFTDLKAVLEKAQRASRLFRAPVEQAELESERRDSRASRLEASGVASALTDADIKMIVDGDLKLVRFVRGVNSWRQARPTARKPILLLLGTAGRGKTVAAASAIAEHGGLFLSAPALLRLFSAKWGDEVAEQRALKRVGLVVIDDLGTEQDPEDMGRVLLEFLNERRHHGTRTILTSNLNQTLFTSMYVDPRLVSRMSESALVISDNGADMRSGV